ncbi:uncharacterized protein LOC111369364 isoform X1 [Olea europaea var. sylvestris]|uniref:uncharacterized protein LOC111369364 isoform X1 n=1 Tax=Olea europaea var. sylvestris TaxID=158386 RepID=UPI000C1CD273|nr:uncharacterized protein LOC111369364 isoform X1 [Olea europaea var. sylvestris]
MLSDIKPKATCAGTVREMSRRLEQKRRSTPQQTSDPVKQKIPPPRADTSAQYRDIFGSGHSFGQPYNGLHRESRQHGSIDKAIQFRYSENHQTTQQGSKTCKDEELVKHMSKLPNFLQEVEKEKSVQEKALNFGVLDWNRLQKWKYNDRMPAKCHRKTSSLSNNSSFMTSGPPKISSQLRKQLTSHSLHPILSSQGKQPSAHSSHFGSSPLRKQFPSQSSYLSSSQVERKTGGIGESTGKGTYIKDLQARRTTADGQQCNFNQKAKSFGRDHSEINMNRGKSNDSMKKIVLEKEALALDRGKNGSSISSPKTINFLEGKSKMRFKDEVNLTTQHSVVEAQNIVLLVPKHFPKTSCSDISQFAESKTLDGQSPQGYWTRFSDGFSPQELQSGEFASNIPHSCPLSTSSIVDTESSMEPPNLVNAEVVDSEFCISADPDDIIVPPIKCEAKRSFSVDASKGMHADAEQKAEKGRHPSPNRRFSFSLGKMTRSFSFKESSAVPQLSSTDTAPKSGPVGSEFSSSMESYNKVKEAASSRGRSSPLRRLLEPLLKYKGAHSAEIVPHSDGNSHDMPSKPMNLNRPIQDRKHEASTFQALLQLSVKNGLPFFKLAADNSNNMLAATVKKLPSSGKGDCSLICTFYSVHEIKKKSMSWINQGTKGKSCELGYNIVAQMKISSSYLPQLNSKDSSQGVVRECVLYGVDLGQVDKKTSEILFNMEIAAIVIKNTCERLEGEDLSDKGRTFKYREITRCLSGEDGNPNSTVVILPVGIHGLPNKGAPSPLINRWKSGGSCDCGGWDVGCKLQILANHERCSKITGPSAHSLASDRLDLFVQSGERGSKPIFSLKPTSNGFYSVEFNASISLLETFSVCVAILTNRKLSEILDVNDLSEAARLSEGTIGQDKVKSQTTLQVPVKYVTYPPSSPVGRI